MSISHLFKPAAKPWLNIKANSIKSKELITGDLTLESTTNISLGGDVGTPGQKITVSHDGNLEWEDEVSGTHFLYLQDFPAQSTTGAVFIPITGSDLTVSGLDPGTYVLHFTVTMNTASATAYPMTILVQDEVIKYNMNGEINSTTGGTVRTGQLLFTTLGGSTNFRMEFKSSIALELVTIDKFKYAFYRLV